jgi:uncharacterized protein YutE (UPF0331/DUF86 family)
LPDFLKDYSPDAIALGHKKNLAIEITGRDRKRDQSLELIGALFAGHPDWEFRVYWIEPATTTDEPEVQPTYSIKARIAEVEELNNEGRTNIALILAWAIFEALGRALLPSRFRRRQTPGRLIEILAQEGYVTPSEADLLQNLAAQRNSFVHGNLQVQTSSEEMNKFIAILSSLITEVEAPA